MESNLRDILGQFQYSSYYADHDDTILNNQLDLAEKAINRLIVEAKLGEFKNFPVTRSYRGYIEGRIKALTKELGSLDDK